MIIYWLQKTSQPKLAKRAQNCLQNRLNIATLNKYVTFIGVQHFNKPLLNGTEHTGVFPEVYRQR